MLVRSSKLRTFQVDPRRFVRNKSSPSMRRASGTVRDERRKWSVYMYKGYITIDEQNSALVQTLPGSMRHITFQQVYAHGSRNRVIEHWLILKTFRPLQKSKPALNARFSSTLSDLNFFHLFVTQFFMKIGKHVGYLTSVRCLIRA